ncbi:DUF3298 and DUF4163 domain-containing protein [Bacteroidales bacterium OttesenSCG-928-M06]|nr:DUF3298 and DUF4163 domain-containing protein [Bacteroidales bacterium OttesenSCG-928-M06]
MKKLNLSFLVISLLCYFTLTTSCDTKTKTVDNPILFKSIEKDEAYYINKDTTKPGCNIKIHFEYPDSSSHKENLLVSMTEIMYGELFKNMLPEQATNEFIKRYVQSFKQFITLTENNEYKEDESIYEDETGYSYYLKLKNTITYNKNHFVSFYVENTSYEGGAHSSKNIHGYVFNLSTNSRLHEDEFAGDNYEKNMANILIEKLMTAKGVKDVQELENLGYITPEDIKPNDNFTLDAKGITYYFNENEIAGTMIGITRIFIPYEELSIYIQKESPISTLITN